MSRLLRHRFSKLQLRYSSVLKGIRDFYAPEDIRNFCIIAHIDHGKSTLAQRLLEHTRTIKQTTQNDLYMDKLGVEKERGITVKAQTASMIYRNRYLLNMVDTPGHADFGYEVARSLCACQGVVLLIDASQGIQSQTLANYQLAVDKNLTVIPLLNKIDLPHSNVERVLDEIEQLLQIDRSQVLTVSAKSGAGVAQVLQTILERVPSPTAQSPAEITSMKALLFDSWHDSYEGPIVLMSVLEGSIRKGDVVKSFFHQNNQLPVKDNAYTLGEYIVNDCGLMHPERVSTAQLTAGMVGYVVLSNVKYLRDLMVGDTFYKQPPTSKQVIEPLQYISRPSPKVYASLFPANSGEQYDALSVALNKLTMTDASLYHSISKTSSASLGLGFRVGFEGMLHLDVIRQRIDQEFGVEVLVCSPSVPYRLKRKTNSKSLSVKSKNLNVSGFEIIDNPVDFPKRDTIEAMEEPIILATIIIPEEYLGGVMNLCKNLRGVQKEMLFLGNGERLLLKYQLPLSEISAESQFHSDLKSITSGYATFDYTHSHYEKSDLVLLELTLNGNAVDALSSICHRSKAELKARQLCHRLKSVLTRDLFEIRIQAMVDGKVLARETIAPFRKDVTAKLYGGDQTRKRKLLDKQKEGKKRMRQIGKVQLPHEAFLQLIQNGK